MRILITGGAGFIASHIIDKYLELNHQVIVVDDLSTGKKEFINKKAKFYKVDIRDKKRIFEIIGKEKPDIINHHAAQISVRESVEDPLFDAQVNIIGLLNLLEAGRDNQVKKIIFASSGGAVYGEANILPTAETYTPLLPLSPYGVTKLASEYYLNFYYQTYRIPYIAFRYANVYGPRQNPYGEAGVVAIFSLKLLKNEIPTINGDGRQTRDYIYVGDVVDVNIKALESKISGSFNIGTSYETDVISLFEKLKKITGKNIAPKFDAAKTGEQKRSCLAINKVREIISWQPQVLLDKGLKITVDYFRNYE